MEQTDPPAKVASNDQLGPNAADVVDRLRIAAAWRAGEHCDLPEAANYHMTGIDDVQAMRDAATEIEALRATAAKWAMLAGAAEGRLPEPPRLLTTQRDLAHTKVPLYDGEQMRAFALAAVKRAFDMRMPTEAIAALWNSLPIDMEGEAIVSFARGVERYHGIGA